MLIPFYQDDWATIYHGDCLEILPQLNHVELVLTDPPYGVHLGPKRPRGMQKHSGATYGFGEDSETYVRDVCVPIVQMCCSMATRTVVTPGQRCMFLYPRPHTIWALYCPAGAGRARWNTFNCWQPVLCYGASPQRVGCIPNVFTFNEQSDWNGHPCPKPRKLWRQLLNAVSDVGDIVLDPFMGSGTTLVVAKALGLRSIGIEIEEKYCQIAVERLRQENLFGVIENEQ